MAIDYSKLKMPTADTPIFGAAPLSMEQAAREAATQQARQAAASVTPEQARRPGEVVSQIVPRATQAISSARMQDRSSQFQQFEGTRQLQEAERQSEAREELFQRAIQIENENENNIRALSNMDSGMAAQLFYDNLKFKEDELGRTLMNDRQLADWAALKAKSQEDFANFEQISLNALDKKIQTVKVAYARIQQALEQQFQKDESLRDQELVKLLSTAKSALEKKAAQAQAKAANNISMWGAIGTGLGAVIGGVVGTVVLPGVGTTAGAMAGSALGGGAATLITSQTQGRPSISGKEDVYSRLRDRYNIRR
jgi:hypothetical protein